jgi:hypothetical protein
MELKRNYKGLKKYEPLLEAICRVEDRESLKERSWLKFLGVESTDTPRKIANYENLSDVEWEGCLGVACVISMIEGIVPNMFSLSKHLDIPHYDLHLQRAFERLRINGVFSKRFRAAQDPALTGMAKDGSWQTGAEVERNAWSIIAGIAGGYAGMRESEKVEKELESESTDVMISQLKLDNSVF